MTREDRIVLTMLTLTALLIAFASALGRDHLTPYEQEQTPVVVHQPAPRSALPAF